VPRCRPPLLLTRTSRKPDLGIRHGCLMRRVDCVRRRRLRIIDARLTPPQGRRLRSVNGPGATSAPRPAPICFEKDAPPSAASLPNDWGRNLLPCVLRRRIDAEVVLTSAHRSRGRHTGDVSEQGAQRDRRACRQPCPHASTYARPHSDAVSGWSGTDVPASPEVREGHQPHQRQPPSSVVTHPSCTGAVFL
jgi:hypothetical protein